MSQPTSHGSRASRPDRRAWSSSSEVSRSWKGAGAVDEFVEEGADPAARTGHQRFEAVVGEVGVVEQFGDLAAQFEDARDQRAIVAVAGRAAVQVGRVDLAAEGAGVGVLKDGLHAGHVEGDEPALLAAGGGQLGGAFEGGVGEASQRVGVRNHLAVGGGLLQEVLLETASEFGEFEAQVFQGLLVGGVQGGAGAAEVAQRAVEVAAAQAGQGGAPGRGREVAQAAVESLVMVEAAREAGDFGERRGVGFAQLGGGVHVVEVGDGGPCAFDLFGDRVELADHFAVRTARPGAQLLDALPGPRESFRHRGAHVAGFDAVEGDREGAAEEGVGVVAHGRWRTVSTQRRVTVATSARTSSRVRPNRFSILSE